MKTARLHVYATAWSLREYPTKADEWSWEKKFAALRAGGFTGIMSPPRAELAERGELNYWAIGSLGVQHDPQSFFAQAVALGATHATIQPCDAETPLEDAIKVAEGIMSAAKAVGLPTTIENHRDTFTETPDRLWALCDGYRERTGEALPVCFDHSHFAVVRHYAAPYWARLNERPDILRASARFHMRPFTGHHCQIPATFDGVRRTPEYALWGDYTQALMAFLQAEGTVTDIHMVPELGHAAPAYGLSCFPDVWNDAQVVAADLQRWWSQRQ